MSIEALIIIILLIIVILLNVINNQKSKKEVELKTAALKQLEDQNIEELKTQLNLTKQMLEVKLDTVIDSSSKQVHGITQSMDNKLNIVTDTNANSLAKLSQSIDQKVSNHNLETMTQLKNTIAHLETKLNTQSEVSNNQIKEVIEHVTKLQGIQSGIEGLNDSVSNLSAILNDKKARGNFGEIRLQQIFEAVFGSNDSLWQRQYKLSNGKLVDFILFALEPIGNICVDSKFPLENYLKMLEATAENEKKISTKAFKDDIKKHINDIHSKYIISGETSDQAIMFVPSESIFSEIYSSHEDLVNYSYEKKVWISSPTTLMAIVNIIYAITREVKRQENSKEIQEELRKLKVEFDRFETRWTTLMGDITKLSKDAGQVDITSTKIIKKFDNISEVEI